jgi:hypothetical protein
MPANIIVTVVDDTGDALQNAAVTLTGNGNPQMLVTDANGVCTFPNLAAGKYRLVVVHEGLNTTAMVVQHEEAAESNVRVVLKVVEEAGARSGKGFFRILTAVQYVFLFLIAAVFAVVLYQGIAGSNLDLGDTNAARGMITFVVSVVTVAIALILVMSSAFLSGSKDLDKRFAFGKDVFTILVGVLGTVMGFYYGQTASANPANNNGAAGQPTIQISEPQLSSATPKLNTEFTLTTAITGGEAPYNYIVMFDNPKAIKNPPAADTKSDDGKISQKFTVAEDATLAGKPVGFEIKVKDKKGVEVTSKKTTFTPTQ